MPLQHQKVYHRKEIALCHACYSITTSKTQVEYALARFQVREAGFLPFSFSELETHDRILHETITRIKEVTSAYKTLTEDQVKHLIAYLQHQLVKQRKLAKEKTCAKENTFHFWKNWPQPMTLPIGIVPMVL